MRSDNRASRSTVSIALAWTLALAAIALTQVTSTIAQKVERKAGTPGPRFYPDDPVWVDPDSRDVGPVAAVDLSKSYEFVIHTFSDPAKSDGPSLNVNSLGEVPVLSWFTNRIGDLHTCIARRPPRPRTGAWLG